MSDTWFETVEEVHEFFGRYGVKVLNVGYEGGDLAAEVESDADIEIMRGSGLIIDDTRRNNGKIAVVFYPKKPTHNNEPPIPPPSIAPNYPEGGASGGMHWSDLPDF